MFPCVTNRKFIRLIGGKQPQITQNKVRHDEFKKRFMPLQQMLYREAYRMLCDRFEAEDAVQNLYVKLWEKKEELKNLVAPEAYCRTLLRNICIDRWRQLRAHDGDEQIETEEIAVYTPPETDKKEAEECYKSFGNAYKNLDGWSAFVITSANNFERYFGKKCDRERKLYNSNKECKYYYYYGKKEKIND